jgi:hypothetical protein
MRQVGSVIAMGKMKNVGTILVKIKVQRVVWRSGMGERIVPV